MKAYRDAKRLSPKGDTIDVTSSWGLSGYERKPNWHESFDDAMVQVDVMTERKLKSLRKAIDRIEALVFKDPALAAETSDQAGDGRADLSGDAPGE